MRGDGRGRGGERKQTECGFCHCCSLRRPGSCGLLIDGASRERPTARVKHMPAGASRFMKLRLRETRQNSPKTVSDKDSGLMVTAAA